MGRSRYIGPGTWASRPSIVDDVAAGIVAALDRGRIGESYVLGGENLRLVDAMRVAARIGGKRPATTRAAGGPRARLVEGARRRCPCRRDARRTSARSCAASLGVTYWASSAKAATELGYRPRDLASGLRTTFGDG